MFENSAKESLMSSSRSSGSPDVSALVTPNNIEEVKEPELLKIIPPQGPPPSSSGSISLEDFKPSFNYDLEVFNLCKEYLNTRNHHGLALITRQKGIPPFLRFKVWPILLKSHPFVINPFIQPDQDLMKESSSSSTSSSTSTTGSPINSEHSSIKDGILNQGNDTREEPQPQPSDPHEEIRRKIKRDLGKYIQRLKYSQSKYTVSELEHQIISILEDSVLKFILKWGKIIKYDLSLTWVALNLAEWFPPIPKTPWVLVGRDYSTADSSLVINLMDDYSNYIDNIPDLKSYLENLIYNDEKISNMSFREVFERLVLVLLHCPEPESRRKKSEVSKHASDLDHSHVQSMKVNKTTLPKTGGTIEERVSYFIYCLRKLLPELSQYFHEEQILTKFGCLDDEWLIWWLKFCGTKVWSKYDRGRIWDFMLGWRLKNPRRDFNYYYEKLNYVNRNTLEKLGPDIFWSVGSEDNNNVERFKNNQGLTRDKKTSSFKDLINDLHNDLHISKKVSTSPDVRNTSHSSILDSSPNFSIPFSRVDPHIALIFISLSLLKSKENTLVELDQHEIRQYLSRLPTKSYKYKLKNKMNATQKRMSSSSNSSSNSTSPFGLPLNLNSNTDDPILLPTNRIIISNDSNFDLKHKVNFIDNIILESGELWRKWLWLEMIDDN